LIGNHDLPLYRISHPPLFYHKEADSKIQAAYDVQTIFRAVNRLAAKEDPFCDDNCSIATQMLKLVQASRIK